MSELINKQTFPATVLTVFRLIALLSAFTFLVWFLAKVALHIMNGSPVDVTLMVGFIVSFMVYAFFSFLFFRLQAEKR